MRQKNKTDVKVRHFSNIKGVRNKVGTKGLVKSWSKREKKVELKIMTKTFILVINSFLILQLQRWNFRFKANSKYW